MKNGGESDDEFDGKYDELPQIKPSSSEHTSESVSFDPPLYRQRYLKTVSIIEDFQIACGCEDLKVVDIGCAELSLFTYLKSLNGVTRITMMDLDKEILKANSYKVNPLNSDYVIRRPDPLTVTLACGDARYPHVSLSNTDVITMIEVIEHMYEEDLPDLGKNVFGVIEPMLVVISTPNEDYNHFFPNFVKGTFRHYDHKFEWTELQFKRWCNGIVTKYPSYDVEFTGCGIGAENVFCSQIGIFKRKISSPQTSVNVEERISLPKSPPTQFSLDNDKEFCKGCLALSKDDSDSNCFIVYQVDYPYDTRTETEKLEQEVYSSYVKLRSWLVSNIQYWDMQGILPMLYHSGNIPWASLSSQVNCMEIKEPMVDENKQIGECKSGNLMVSELSGNVLPNQGYSFTSYPANPPPICYQVVPADETDCNAFRIPKNTFVYEVADETFFCLLSTFCSWAKLEDEKKIRKILEECGMSIKDVYGDLCLLIRYEERESDIE